MLTEIVANCEFVYDKQLVATDCVLGIGPSKEYRVTQDGRANKEVHESAYRETTTSSWYFSTYLQC
jgi:hypothetical protein